MKTNQMKLGVLFAILTFAQACQVAEPVAKSDDAAAPAAKAIARTAPVEVAFNELASSTGCTVEQVAAGAKITCGDQFAIVANGREGAAGAQGIQGITGAVGPQGAQGVAGATGAQGVQGIQGVAGAAGSAGAIPQRVIKNGAGAIVAYLAPNSNSLYFPNGDIRNYDYWTGLEIINPSLQTVYFESGNCTGPAYIRPSSGSSMINTLVRSGDNRTWRTGTTRELFVSSTKVFASQIQATGVAQDTSLVGTCQAFANVGSTIDYIQAVNEEGTVATISRGPDLSSIAPLVPVVQ